MKNLSELKLTIKSAIITIFCLTFIIANFTIYNEGNRKINDEYFNVSYFDGKLYVRIGKTIWTFDSELVEIENFVRKLLKKPAANPKIIKFFLLAEEYSELLLNLVKQQR